MEDLELLTILKNQLADTVKYANDDFKKANKDLADSYNQEPYGNEEEGRSQVIASDHYDMVESDMPSLARVFLGANKIMQFKPLGREDIEEAQQKTDYADYIIRRQKDSFKILHDWLKEPGLAKCSVIKIMSEETDVPTYVRYDDLSEDEITITLNDLENQEGVDRVEIESQRDRDGEKYDIRFRVIKKTKKIALANVPVDSFIISRGASSLDEAQITGDETTKTKGEWIADGFDKQLIKDLAPNTETNGNEIKRQRFEGQGGWDYKSGYHWTNEELTIQNLYALVDYDEDGIPERRFIQKCGEKILTNEPYGISPYAVNSEILIPHAVIGKSRGEQAARYQKEKTAVKRGIMDNIYSVNRPGHAVDDSEGSMDGGKVDLDDLMTGQIERVVRVDGDPRTAIMPLVTPYIGSQALEVVQYIDSDKSNTLGAQMSNQGLSSDKLYKETATRFEGVADNAQAKIELVARVFAETGFRNLYEKVIWTAQHYQDEETEVMVLGKPLIVDPRGWQREHYCESTVGLGAGDSEDAINNLGTQLQVQLGLQQAGSNIVDDKKIYNTLDDLTRAMGKPDTSRYFNNPEIPEEVIMAKLETLFKENLILKEQAQQNILAEAELVKAKAKMAEVSGKETNSMRKFLMEMAQKDKQFADTLAKELTELELKYDAQVPGSAV